MALISPTDQERLRQTFAVVTRPVRLLFFTQTLGRETCLQTRRILDELPALSDRISIEEVNFVLEPDKAKQYGIDRVPAVAVCYEDADEHEAERGEGAPAQRVRGVGAPGVIKDSRIRFLGTPAGYEFISLIDAVLLVGGRQSNLSERSRKRIEAVDKPIVMQVFVTPT